MTRLFVYGTLKRGRENHHWLAGQHFIAEARTAPVYRLFDLGGYPGMIRDESGLSIEGEIWDVNEAGMRKLDILEDLEGGEYDRVIIDLHDGKCVQGYLYLRDVRGRRDCGTTW